MEIKTCGLIGMGAIGVVYGDLLYQTYGENFTAIASEKRAERLRREGILHNGKIFHPPVTEPGEGKPVDLLLVCVKITSSERRRRIWRHLWGQIQKFSPC